MIKSILNQVSQLIRDYTAEKARKEKFREQMEIREVEFMKRFEKTQRGQNENIQNQNPHP